ncbi:MAG: M23 family metallopeptidase [Anaerolineales bacterium]|nr:M23 family metallopeptidase [Anaerolineales bacterium]
MNTIKKHLFSIISWSVTLLVVAGLLVFALRKKQSANNTPVFVMDTVTKADAAPPAIDNLPPAQNNAGLDAISRIITLKTDIPADRPRYEIKRYTVSRGDSTFSIANNNNIEPETLLWANYDTLEDSPDSLRVGQELNIPPVDGIYYQWQEGDTIEGVAEEYDANVDEILNWPGNNIDLTDPKFEPGDWIMIPGGSREFVQWVIPIQASGDSGTSNVSGSSCPPGAVGTGYFNWPTANRYLSGNDFWSGHLALDIAAPQGSGIFAADSGVVTMAQGGWNYGYGNVIAIDHGNGFATLYAHLSQINVSVCQSVYAGQLIGASGNTGNSFGAHLHFEIRNNGAFENPWNWLP